MESTFETWSSGGIAQIYRVVVLGSGTNESLMNECLRILNERMPPVPDGAERMCRSSGTLTDFYGNGRSRTWRTMVDLFQGG